MYDMSEDLFRAVRRQVSLKLAPRRFDIDEDVKLLMSVL